MDRKSRVGSWHLEVCPIPIRPRKAFTSWIAIGHIVVEVVALVELSFQV